MCYRTECGKCGKPTWVRDTRRAVAHHDSTARRAVPSVPARTTFFTPRSHLSRVTHRLLTHGTDAQAG